MANKTQATRQKMVFRLEATRPRNPFATAARKRAAGAHEKSTSARRALDKRAVADLVKDIDKETD